MQICPTDLSFAFGTFWDIFCEYFNLQLNFWMPNPWVCCRKGDLFQGPGVGSCLTLRNELSKETHVLTKHEILLAKGAQVESRRVREPRRTALSPGLQSRVLW